MRGVVAAAIVMVALAAACDVVAAGFAVQEQTGRGLGSAFAGEGAAAEDASTIWFNPAGLSLLSGTQLAASGFAILPSSRFENAGSSLNPVVGGGVLGGGNGGDAGSLALIPTFFLAHELTSRVAVGLGVGTPFGLTTSYDAGWVGRYHALSSRLDTVNVNPSLAVRVTPWLSIGGGADIEYARARLTNSLDLGSICRIFGAAQGIPPAVCDALGLPPGRVDGFVKISGDDWNAGYNAGLLLAPTAATRIGLAYRSRIHHDLGGEATFVIPKKAAILERVSGALRDTGGHAAVDFPERVALSGFHQLTRRWALLADVTWTHWDRFEDLVFRFDNPKQPTIVQPERWTDSFRYALGVRFDPLRTVSLRLGTAYDETPVPNEARRTPRIPDADRVWLAVGAGWRPTNRLRFDVGYAHIFSPGVSTANRDPVTGHLLRGDYSSEANVLGVQLTYQVGCPPLGDLSAAGGGN